MRFLRPLFYLWASPTTLLGLLFGGLGLLTGTKIQRRGPSLEFHGGLVKWLLMITPVGAGAMTLGHVIIGRDSAILDRVREHEWVHVRQYERWGPMFLPAYIGCSIYLWLRGRDAYRENPFEIEAFESDRLRALNSPT